MSDKNVAPDLTAELASMTRIFHAACADLGAINEALGLAPDDGGAAPILEAISELKSARDKWMDANYASTAVQAEGVRVLTADDADMVWPDYDGETFHHSIDDAVEYEVGQEWPVDGELELKVQLAKRIPTATIRIFNITESGHEWEIVAAPAASTGEQEVGS